MGNMVKTSGDMISIPSFTMGAPQQGKFSMKNQQFLKNHHNKTSSKAKPLAQEGVTIDKIQKFDPPVDDLHIRKVDSLVSGPVSLQRADDCTEVEELKEEEPMAGVKPIRADDFWGDVYN